MVGRDVEDELARGGKKGFSPSPERDEEQEEHVRMRPMRFPFLLWCLTLFFSFYLLPRPFYLFNNFSTFFPVLLAGR